MIAVVIPDRGDRPEFLNHCLWLIDQQTIKPAIIEIVDYPPLNGVKDITPRYRQGLKNAFAKGALVALLIENDDWYAPTYIEQMIKGWLAAGSPSLFGIGYTTYYHLGQRRYKTLKHPKRASAMNTLISALHPLTFPPDEDPFFDLHIWQTGGKTFFPKEIISIGIKHGVGLCGGKAHKIDFKYDKQDNGLLKKVVDKRSFDFYSRIGG